VGSRTGRSAARTLETGQDAGADGLGTFFSMDTMFCSDGNEHSPHAGAFRTEQK
jgi:hypothetical protein